jgi:hypothetical protein
MQIPYGIAVNLLQLFLDMTRHAVRYEIQTLIQDFRENDRLHTACDSAQMLAVSPDGFNLYGVNSPQLAAIV